MAPFGLLTACVSLLVKPRNALSCPAAALFRCNRLLPATCSSLVKCLTTQTSGPPKRPLNGYLRFVMQQKPIVTKENPESKPIDVVGKIAKQWRTMSLEQKQPFQDASLRAREQFKVDLQRYQAQLTPEQLEQQTLEKRQRLAKRKAMRKKRELNNLGKPKRPRTPFNIFMAEHFEEARGATTPAKLVTLYNEWRNLFGHQKKVYTQLAEDDKIRYKNEMTSWEDHMVEIGREDLIREQTLSSKRKALLAKKVVQKTAAKKASTTVRKAKSISKTKTGSSSKTVAKTIKKN
ncbi:transcription factor A, mitochondrial [Gouania willdenowi]|uniref:Transcription factor A, mitochondrial n=1 Tax=Gouania willdenowi TaxID=441366 RepID=A0A8C5GT13_GOUWI|nr:transcription factor A, mitochondrial [Gouania willdenowi]